MWGPPYAGGHSTYYLGVNRNKRSIVLDLRDPADVKIARTLAEHADALVENFRPGTMGKFGLDEPNLRAANPRLVYCSISAFGAGVGVGRDLPGYDLLVQATGGLMSITGPHEGEPTKVGAAIVDVLARLFATVGILAALRDRDRTGHGPRVEINLLSALLSGLANQAAGYVLTGTVPHAIGNAHPSIAPYDVFDTADGPLALAVGTDRQFGQLSRIIGEPDLAADDRFRTNELRVRHRGELRTCLERRLATRRAREWTVALTAAGVPAGAVNNVGEAFALAEDLGLASIRRTADLDADGDDADPLGRQVANPIALSATPVTYRTRAPRLGEHSQGIRRRLDELDLQCRTA